MPRTAVSLARFLPAHDPGPPDAQLLRAFVAARGEDVFAEIVRRHGPMVLAACRRVLGHRDDADDAFQATFLVLARKATAIRGANLAGWLYAVAVRTARGVRIMRDRRRRHELRANSDHRGGATTATPDGELAAVIDEELAKLPECFREAVVLCELRGLSRKEAAAEIGVPEGTLSSRLAAAKRKLAARLSARGLSAPAALAAVLAPASVSAALTRSAIAAAHGLAAPVANAAASAIVKAMLFDQLKAVALAAGILMSVACGGWAMTANPDDGPPATPASDDSASKLVARLGAENFADREAAQAELRKLGPRAEPALRAALTSDNPEVRDRAAKLLTTIRRDALDSLAKGFDPAKDTQPDHPVWNRFKAIAGDTKASRELFARIIRNEDWRHRLDAAESGPESAARQYREACVGVGKHYRSNLSVWFEIPVWPCDRGEEVAYLLLLGSYPGTPAARPAGQDRDFQEFADGEGRIHFARGLELGLQGKMVDVAGGKFRPDTVAATPGTDRVIGRLLAAWLGRREPAADVVPPCLWLAARHGAKEVLPLARTIAADEFVHKRLPPTELYAAALTVVAAFGTQADLPLFERYFDDATTLVIAPPPTDKEPGPRSQRPKVHDRAIGLALLLCDRDPAEFGFPYAKDRFRRENGRPVVANYEAEAFGFPDDKTREEAHKKAKAFLAAQLKKQNEKEPPAKGAKLWPRFAEVIGDDVDSRALFDLIVANPKNLELLEKVTERPDAAGKLYHDRWRELNKAARIPTGEVGSHRLEQAPLADVLGWMYLGTFPGAEGAFHQSYSLDFLPQMPPARTASDELRDALQDKTLSAPLRRLFGAWIATRVDYTGRDFGLQMALAYDIKDVLPAARTMLTTKVKDDPYPGNTARNLGFAMLVVGKLGTKDDLPLLERYAKDGTECARFLNDPPPKPGQPHLRLPRPPVEGQDATTQLRDVSVAMRLHLLGQKPDDFGFYWDWPNGPEAGRRNRMGEFYLHAIGFLRAVDREAAHAKAKEWLDKQKKADPPARGAKVWPHFAKVVGDDAGSRLLFDRIVADPKNLELLERAADGDPDLAKAYFARRDELYAVARREVPGKPGVVRAVPVPAADAAGWLLLGTYPATKVTAPTEVTLTFLHRDPGKAASPLLDLLQERNPESAPLRKLVGAWLANRGDDSTAYADALPLALRHDIPEALPTARRLLKDYAESKGNGGRPFTLSHVRATSLLVIAKYGAKADLPQVEAFLKDDNLASSTVRTTPAGGEPITAQVRDAAAVAAVHLRGGDVRDMGFLWPTKLDGVPVAGVFDLSHIGFRDATDREAAHSKAKGWLDKQKGEPKREEPAAGLLRDLADLDDLRRGEQTDFAAVEKRGGELLAKYPAAADRGRIYATLTRLHANSGIGRTFARVTKYGRLALEHENNPVARGQVFSYLASAAEVAVTTADPLADDPLPVKRRRAAEILLEGYRELLPLKLPDAAPELPGVEKIGGLLNGTDPAEEARVRERHAAQVKAREEAAVVRDLVHSRDTYAMQLKSLYGREPKADDELQKLAAEALKDPKAVADLIDRVAKSR